MFLNQKLRALALIINAARFVTSSNYHLSYCSHNVYNIFLVYVILNLYIIYSITLF